MAEATMGMLSVMPRVIRDRMSTSEGSTSDRPGLSSTSSKVRPSRGLFLSIANSACARVIPAGLLVRALRKAGTKDEIARVEQLALPACSSTSMARFWVGGGS
jgi:hypothetical protein